MGHDEQRISDQIDSGLLKQKEIEDTEDGNKVLAEFMDYDKEKWWHLKRHEFEPAFSWDSIFPVWIKFRDSKVDDFDYIDHSHCVDHLKDLLFRSDSPSDFFPHIVEAVKWFYQTQKK